MKKKKTLFSTYVELLDEGEIYILRGFLSIMSPQKEFKRKIEKLHHGEETCQCNGGSKQKFKGSSALQTRKKRRPLSSKVIIDN
jgi:hypothetical protein